MDGQTGVWRGPDWEPVTELQVTGGRGRWGGRVLQRKHQRSHGRPQAGAQETEVHVSGGGGTSMVFRKALVPPAASARNSCQPCSPPPGGKHRV